MTIPKLDLADLQAKCDAATPGMWVVHQKISVIVEGSDGRVGYAPKDGTIASLDDGEYIANKNAKKDAAFIATARTAMPQCIAALRAAEAREAKLREALLYVCEDVRHDDEECPEDDTCECRGIALVNAALASPGQGEEET